MGVAVNWGLTKEAPSPRIDLGPLITHGGTVGIPTTDGIMMSAPFAFVVKLEAKPEKSSEVAELLHSALPLAQAEEGTLSWYAVQTSDTVFWIFDTFPDEDSRQAHIGGPIAAALMANADELLAAAPEILPADVLAAK